MEIANLDAVNLLLPVGVGNTLRLLPILLLPAHLSNTHPSVCWISYRALRCKRLPTQQRKKRIDEGSLLADLTQF